MEPARVLFLDIETAPSLGHVWGKYQQDVIEFERSWYILSFAVRWKHQTKVLVRALPDYPGYRADSENDKRLCQELWKFFNEADIIVAHNAAFDLRKSNARFLAHGLPPPSSYKIVCTLKLARRCFKMDSNRLDDISVYLKLPHRKLAHTGKHLWLGCMRGDIQAWKKMRLYNARDVELLYQVYLKLRAWAPNHPSLTYISRKPNSCPVCESGKLVRNGLISLRTGYKQQFLCMSCRHQFRGGPLHKLDAVL